MTPMGDVGANSGSTRRKKMRKEAEILREMANSPLDVQRKLMVELNSVKAARRQAVQDSRDTDIANAVIRDTLTPVIAYERTTTATDWLGDAPASGEGYDHAMRTEASMWFRKVSKEVKADRDEFSEQAMGVARRQSGRFGESADAAYHAFLEAVARLYRQSNDSPGQVDEDQSGNAESTVTDYDTDADQDPMWAEDWDGEDDTGSDIGAGVHPEMPGASGSDVDPEPAFEARRRRASRKTALQCSCAHNNDGSVTTLMCPLHADEDPCYTLTLVTGGRRKGSIINGVCSNCGWTSGGTTARLRKRAEGQTCSVCGDAIQRDPEGEENRSWHHDNGETHDHEAKPSGSTEARRRQGRRSPKGSGANAPTTGARKTAAPQDGDSSYCRICGQELRGMDYAWYGLKSSSPQRDVGAHIHIPARNADWPGEFNASGELVPGTPGGGDSEWAAPAGTIFDGGANPIAISSSRKTAIPEGWHYASPLDPGVTTSTCTQCGKDVYQTQGGQGPTWAHSDTDLIPGKDIYDAMGPLSNEDFRKMLKDMGQTTGARKTAITTHTLADPNVWKQLEKLPKLYSTDGKKGDRPAVKLFDPYGMAIWIIWEYDPSEKVGFGWAEVVAGGGELGYVSLEELADLDFMGQKGLRIERDSGVTTMVEGFNTRGITPPSYIMASRKTANYPSVKQQVDWAKEDGIDPWGSHCLWCDERTLAGDDCSQGHYGAWLEAKIQATSSRKMAGSVSIENLDPSKAYDIRDESGRVIYTNVFGGEAQDILNGSDGQNHVYEAFDRVGSRKTAATAAEGWYTVDGAGSDEYETLEDAVAAAMENDPGGLILHITGDFGTGYVEEDLGPAYKLASRKTASQKAARDLLPGDEFVKPISGAGYSPTNQQMYAGGGIVTKVEEEWGTVSVWLDGSEATNAFADWIFNHGDPVEVA